MGGGGAWPFLVSSYEGLLPSAEIASVKKMVVFSWAEGRLLLTHLVFCEMSFLGPRIVLYRTVLGADGLWFLQVPYPFRHTSLAGRGTFRTVQRALALTRVCDLPLVGKVEASVDRTCLLLRDGLCPGINEGERGG